MIAFTRECNEYLDMIFERFRDGGMTIKLSKCVIGTRKVDFSGRYVKDGMIDLQKDNIKKINLLIYHKPKGM